MSGCEHAFDDGAYVLGALSPAERTAYEGHLAGCASCRQSVHELAALPGLLGRLDAGAVPASDSQPAIAPRLSTLVVAAQRARRRERWSHRWRYALAAFTAAGLAAAVTLGVVWLPAEPGPDARPALVAMRPVAETAVSAEIGLTDVGWGTEITMRCHYPVSTYAKRYPFRLIAKGQDGTREQVASWLAGPGDTVLLTGTTRLSDDLVRVELTRGDGTPLLTYHVS